MSATSSLDEPAFILDGARVLRYALIDTARADGHSHVIVDGTPLDLAQPRRVVIAQNLVDDSVFLMHCNGDWETLVATRYPDAAAAEAGAREAYGALAPVWTPFRELSEEEAREAATTRAFLREIAAEG
jgi:hypothetical protein